MINMSLKSKCIPRTVHRLVAQAFILNPFNKPQVNHINGDKTDNRVENLEWATGSENILHAMKNGLINIYGERATTATLTNKEVVEIKEMLGTKKHTYKYIGNNFNTSSAVIGQIARGETWRNIF